MIRPILNLRMDGAATIPSGATFTAAAGSILDFGEATVYMPGANVTVRYVAIDQADRYALTTADVQNGDYVYQTDTGLLYEVTDDTALNGAGGYTALATISVSQITGLGTNVGNSLGIAIGNAGAFVTFNGAGGTPSSLTLTNATGLPVAGGGTGRATSTTAYGLIAAGTTATGAQQTLAAGATTEILVGGGAAALPVWTTATGSGAPVRGTSPTFTTSIIAGSSTMALFNTTATTVNAFGAATNIVMGGANSIGITTTSQLYLPLNSLTTGTGFYLASSSLTSGKMLDIQVTGTTSATSPIALNVSLAGANSGSSTTSTAATFSNTRTNLTSNTNVALTLTASGGTTNNALNITAGNSLFPDGSASAPSFQFGSDTNTGIYRIGSDNIGIATNGILRWHVSSGGNLFSGSANYDYNIGASLFLGSSGSAAAPTFSFGSSADTNTGMYRVSEDQIGFTAGGTLRATINTTDLILTVGLTLPKTITAGGTTGAQTINKTSGSVNFAAGATSLVVTNSLVTTSSVILVTGATNDADQSVFLAVAAAGSFTIYPGTAGGYYSVPLAETRVNFLVLN